MISTRQPCLRRRQLDRRADLGDQRPGRRVGVAAHVEPGIDPRGDDVGAAGHRDDPADGRPRVDAARRVVAGGGDLPGGEHGGRRRHHGVPAARHRGGAGVVALPGERQPPPAVRQDRRRDRDRRADVGERAALLDVQLDEAAERGQALVVPARSRPGSTPAAAAAWANVTPAASVRAAMAAGSTAPVISFDPRQAMPNLDPSSSANAITATGRDRDEAVAP